MREATYIAIITLWLAGIVLAQGWWKLLAIFFPFYAWYLVIERIMALMGFL